MKDTIFKSKKTKVIVSALVLIASLTLLFVCGFSSSAPKNSKQPGTRGKAGTVDKRTPEKPAEPPTDEEMEAENARVLAEKSKRFAVLDEQMKSASRGAMLEVWSISSGNIAKEPIGPSGNGWLDKGDQFTINNLAQSQELKSFLKTNYIYVKWSGLIRIDEFGVYYFTMSCNRPQSNSGIAGMRFDENYIIMMGNQVKSGKNYFVLHKGYYSFQIYFSAANNINNPDLNGSLKVSVTRDDDSPKDFAPKDLYQPIPQK